MEMSARNLVIGIAVDQTAEAGSVVDSIVRSVIAKTHHRVSLAILSEGPPEPVLRSLAGRASASSSLPVELLQKSHETGLIALAIQRNADLIVLQPDVTLFEDTLTEILTVAASDPMIGFVTPRTNQAGSCTFPTPATQGDSERLHAEFSSLSPRLPRVTYARQVESFCLYTRAEILQEFAADVASAAFTSDLASQLIRRSNRCGYRAVIANWAFAYRPPTASSELAPDAVSVTPGLETGPHPSPGDRAFVTISRLRSTMRPSIAFDFAPDARKNGTAEFGVRVVEAFATLFRDKFDLNILCDASIAEFHGLDKIPGLRLLPPTTAEIHSAVVRLSQPFDLSSLSRVFSKGAVVIVSMLDCIAYDCLDLTPPDLDQHWDFVLNRSDAIIYISDFTKLQFARRFRPSDGVEHTVCMPSTDINEFNPSPEAQAEGDYLLIIGNHHAHKWIAETVRLLRAELPGEKLKVLGAKLREFPDVESFESGGLSDAFVAKLYCDAKAVVFPSHYEGFGLPVMHALGHRKVVFARDLPVYQEVMARISVPRNFRIFKTDTDLVGQLNKAAFRWEAPHRDATDVGWDRTARELEAVVARALASADWQRIEARLAHLQLLETAAEAAQRAALSRRESEHAQAEVQHLRNEVAVLLNSTSWRLTRFPRKLKEYLRGGRR